MEDKMIGAMTATLECIMDDLISRYPSSVNRDIEFCSPRGDYESEFTDEEKEEIKRRVGNFLYALAGYEQLQSGENAEYIKGLLS